MKRIVIKLGSNIVASTDDSSSGLHLERIDALVADIWQIMQKGNDIVMVSSGAIAVGMRKLGITVKPRDIKLKQAAAALGQAGLIHAYERAFNTYAAQVAQILLTRDVVSDRIRYINARNTITTLLDLKVIPIINENDTISVDEIKFGDNDNLAALVSGLIDADMLIILSDVEGLYSSDPLKDKNARLIEHITSVDTSVEEIAGKSSTHFGTGGMYSKVLAAKKAMGYGIPVVIMSGINKGLLPQLIEGTRLGTFFEPSSKKLPLRKRWIAHAQRAKGSLCIDTGAVKALVYNGKSLLPSGIMSVTGHFNVGDIINCLSPKGEKIARGLTNYSSGDIEKIKGIKTGKIDSILGFKYSDEVIHRDNLVLL
jgi:glutamate 5-kinase